MTTAARNNLNHYVVLLRFIVLCFFDFFLRSLLSPVLLHKNLRQTEKPHKLHCFCCHKHPRETIYLCHLKTNCKKQKREIVLDYKTQNDCLLPAYLEKTIPDKSKSLIAWMIKSSNALFNTSNGSLQIPPTWLNLKKKTALEQSVA